MTRIYQRIPLSPDAMIQLDDQASHYVAHVLRAAINEELIIFNGEGGEYSAVITAINKKNTTVKIKKFNPRESESSLELYLAQGISRGEKMDYTIQKAVELGIKKILPLLTERSTVKLDEERRIKRQQHWQSVAISACEQSGRNHVPVVLMPESFTKGLSMLSADWKFLLSPTSNRRLKELPIQSTQHIILLIGPEGGLSENEIQEASRNGFLPLNLGPRILRTETAAVAAITALQCYFGDLN
jgi:16S rRNA (uracil1498-N3)-methyltransferase